MTGFHPAVMDVELSGGNFTLVVIVAVIALAALAMAAMFRSEVLAAGEGTDNMKNIAQAVQEGANAYLARQFRTLGIFAAVVFFVCWPCRLTTRWSGSGDRSSSWSGRYSPPRSAISVCRWLSARTYASPRQPKIGSRSSDEHRLPYRRVVGMSTVGLGLFGAASLYSSTRARPLVLEGFGFGAAMLAMFMRVGGGIFTKAADVGADLVGKVEQNIPEDDPRNAATIADNVGDNVGDCAGMAADLFESYAVTLVAALILGSQAFGDKGLVFPLLFPAIGAITAVHRHLLTVPRAGENGLKTDQPRLLHLGCGRRCRVRRAAYVYLPSTFAGFENVAGPRHGSRRGRPATVASIAVYRHRDGRRHPALTGYFTETEQVRSRTCASPR